MDEIKQRLTEASEACIKTYEAWRAKTSDHSLRESLQEAVHELRKVAARLEIELAVSDRKTQGNEPIPIPSHRASRRPAQGADLDLEDDNNNINRNPASLQPRDRGGRNDRGGSRPVQIRRPEGNGDAGAPAGSDGNVAEGKSKPLSLRRGGADSE